MDWRINFLPFIVLAIYISEPSIVEALQLRNSSEIYPSDENVSQPLYFGLMMSFGGSLKSSGVVPGVQVALDIINNMSLLGEHTLHYILYDSQVKPA